MSPTHHPTMIGAHRLGARLGCGAQGEVYAAHDTRSGRDVALKLLHHLGRRSAAEIRACAKLDHPNIVPIYEAGEHEGWPYITMKLLKGTLADKANMARYTADPEATVLLMESIARAVHHLHQRGILHRDLKPANILLDDAGVPYVADFGVAKHVDESDHGTIAGTRRYMAPEQLDGHNTVRCDVYSLGVILYELLTGRRPFAAEDTAELIREIRESAPKDPRKLRPELHVDLALICLRCLEKSPADRYGSAEALADALRRHANGELPDGASRAQRVWRWYLRHAATTGLISAVVTFLLIMIPTAFSLIHAHGSLKRAQITQANMNSAAMVAGAVLWQLGELEDAVELAAREPLLARAMTSGDAAWQQSLCESFFDRSEDPENGLKLTENPPFDSWFLLDPGGGLTAQSGMADDVHIIGMNFEWRDYFAGAWALGQRGRDGAYVSRVIRSENDGFHKFAISTPIYDSERQLVGVLVAAVATSAKLGSLVLDNPQGTTALVAPRDRERGGWPEVSHMILLHPRYGYGEADPLSSAQVEMLDRASQGRLRIEQPLRLPSSSLVTSSDDYRDPAAERHPEFAGRWIAGFAPVGNTGIVVIVQTPHDVLGLEAQFGGQMVMWTCVSAVPSGLLMLFAAWHQRRRRRPGPPGPTALHPLAGSRA